MTKQCKRCLAVKNIDQFYKDSRAKDGKRSKCSACECEIHRLRTRGIIRKTSRLPQGSWIPVPLYSKRVGIPLGRSDTLAIIDEQDLPLVKSHTWYLNKTNSAVFTRRSNGTVITLGRVLIPDSRYRIHKNGNPLDHTRKNLVSASVGRKLHAKKMRKMRKESTSG